MRTDQKISAGCDFTRYYYNSQNSRFHPTLPLPQRAFRNRIGRRRAQEMGRATTEEAAAKVYKVAEAELRCLPANRRVYRKRSGLFFLDSKQNVLADTVGKLRAIEKK